MNMNMSMGKSGASNSLAFHVCGTAGNRCTEDILCEDVLVCEEVGSRVKLINEPIYQFWLDHHFIKTRWIVHDLQREKARNFRCEYSGTKKRNKRIGTRTRIDQLGFAYVMAKRGLRRMIGRVEHCPMSVPTFHQR